MFFIRNCNGQIVGNPKGYRTHKGAHQQAESRTSKVHARIWADFYENEEQNKARGNNLIYSIRLDPPDSV